MKQVNPVVIGMAILLGFFNGTETRPQTKASPGQPAIAYAGLYEAVAANGLRTWLRFYKDGTALRTHSSPGAKLTDSSQVLKTFNKFNETGGVDKGQYTVTAGQLKIDFSGFGYEGSILPGRLSLRYYPASGGKESPLAQFEFVPASIVAADAPPEKPTLRYDGTWEGTTSQLTPISIVIKDGLIVRVTVGYNIPNDRCFFPSQVISVDYSSATTKFRVYEGKSFRAGRYSGAPGSVLFFLEGRATAANSMSGTVGFAAVSCQDTPVEATWKATRAGGALPQGESSSPVSVPQPASSSGIRFDGLYRREEGTGGKIKFYARFFPDGTAAMLPTETLEQAAVMSSMKGPTQGSYTVHDSLVEIKIEVYGAMKGRISEGRVSLQEGSSPLFAPMIQGNWVFVPVDFAEVEREWRTNHPETLPGAPGPGSVPNADVPKTVAAVEGQATESGTSPDFFVLKGVVVGPNGPLVNKVVMVSPMDAATGKAQTRFVPVGDGRMEMINPRTSSGAKGAFSLKVPRALFRETPGCAVGCTQYLTGQLKLGVYTDTGGGKLSSSLDSTTIKFDEKGAVVDAGRVVLGPLK